MPAMQSTRIKDSLSALKNATAAREIAFKPLNSLITRVMNALAATGVSKEVLDNARSIGRKIQGIRVSPRYTEEEKKAIAEAGSNARQISSSQMSFDQRLDNLNGLIRLLKNIKEYLPNEEDLKIEGITALYEELKGHNNAVIAATIALNNARIHRNKVLYDEKTGLITIARNAKAYIKSVYGATNPVYKQVAPLHFRVISLS